jgi:hypothetical protein
MNKINVTDKTEKLKLGKYYELRGNFEEIESEDGEVSYSCNMFRTTDSTKTFGELYEAELKQEAIQYLSNTNYVAINYSNLLKVDEEKAQKYFEGVSYTYGITVKEILKQRAEYIGYLNDF